LLPHLENGERELSFTHRICVSGGMRYRLEEVRFFAGRPALALIGNGFYLLRNAPPPQLLEHWAAKPEVPVRKLSHRLLMHLRRTQANHGVDWEQLVVTHRAAPQLTFELLDETVRVRLLARSERDQSLWLWNGHEWASQDPKMRQADKPEILDDPRLEPATAWLRKLDWFTPEPGLWVGDANEGFLGTLARVWEERPPEVECLGNAAFHRLFLSPRQLRPRLVVKGSGIDWLSVSAEWEQEGLKLSSADLHTAADRDGTFREAAGYRLGGTGFQRGAVRARSDGGPRG
jgi:hypothetical protein